MHVGYDPVQADDLGLHHLLPAECQEVTGQRAGFIGGGIDLRKLIVHGGAAGLFQQKLAVALDDSKDVVEVVSDHTRERADGFHPLGFAQLFFHFAALGHVDRNAKNA